ncbi:MAG TPA: enoyl-CoA hydratase-related protein [Vicinamibacterales bacterium]|nr:enoyl-CoA hydratase/isomerase family protein [Acidobacteriota bacterium]HQX80176.1 enoyl-CoA hydratase-related protein [Vicinamibacterales bacterium]
MPDLVTITPLDEGAIWRVTFGGGKGNILDRPTMEALGGVFRKARTSAPLKAIVLEGEGRHFSFGASVQEHLPGPVAVMLSDIRQLVTDLLECQVTVLAAVRGQCLGGGLEVVSLCHRIFAAPDAKLGQPEIALGVFAPIASIALPARVGRAHGEDLCLTGRIVSAPEALVMGLVDEVTDGDPAEAAMAWARTHLTSRSASSLRLAVKAVRADLTARMRTELPALEHLYLDELMATHDAVEGLQAFVEKRPPVWKHQ